MKKLAMIMMLLLFCFVPLNSTTYAGWTWDHAPGNYLGYYSKHSALYFDDGSIMLIIKCYPSKKVCWNIYGSTLTICDTPIESMNATEEDLEEWTVIGTN